MDRKTYVHILYNFKSPRRYLAKKKKKVKTKKKIEKIFKKNKIKINMRKSKKREYNDKENESFFVLLPLPLMTKIDDVWSKEPSKQVIIKGDFSMFGSRAYHDDDAFLDAKKRWSGKSKNERDERELGRRGRSRDTAISFGEKRTNHANGGNL